MRAGLQSSSGTDRDARSDAEHTPYQLTLAALTYSWVRQSAFNIAVGLAFWLVAGPLAALCWTASLCLVDLTLQLIYRRLTPAAAEVDSERGLVWLSWLGFIKSVVWFALPAGFTVLHHSDAGLAFVGVQATGLTALAVSTARNSQRVLLAIVVVPVVALAACVLATVGPGRGAGALGEMLVLAFALWLISIGTSRVVVEWNQAQAERQAAMAEMRKALTRSELAEARLSVALSRAETASQAKSEFLATMSHEIRTPLNGVLGMAQVMQAGELSEAQRERLRIICTSGESLLTLLNDLLDLSKIEAGKVALEDGVVDIEALAAGARAFAPLLLGRDIGFTVTVSPQAQGRWSGDPARVRQVLHNLISNALKFTHRGSVSIEIGHDGAGLILAVEDTGVGIAAARLDEIFDPFVQADASTTRRYGGSGLGLAICRDLVALMGGAVEVESTEGVGSRFTVRLPLARAEGEPATPQADLAAMPSLEGLRVLAAEDNLVNQMVLRTLLEACGVELTLVSDGQQAVEAWRDGRWDMVLMDIHMPVMDGVAALGAIREAEHNTGRARTPIIALTANAMDHHRSEYSRLGMDALIAKPIDLEVMIRTMGSVLERAGDEPVAASPPGRALPAL